MPETNENLLGLVNSCIYYAHLARILDIQSTGGILRFGVIFSKSLIYGGYLRFPKSWGRQNFNWFPIFTEFKV